MYKKELKNELLIALYLVGDLCIYHTKYENEDVRERMRDYYFNKWIKFANKHTKTAVDVFNKRMDEYQELVQISKKDKDKDIIDSISDRICEFCSIGLGKELRELVGGELDITAVFTKPILDIILGTTIKGVIDIIKHADETMEIV